MNWRTTWRRWRREHHRKYPHPIGGALDQAALARLNFLALSQGEQAAQLRRLAAAGHDAAALARVTGLAVEAVREVLTAEVQGKGGAKPK